MWTNLILRNKQETFQLIFHAGKQRNTLTLTSHSAFRPSTLRHSCVPQCEGISIKTQTGTIISSTALSFIIIRKNKCHLSTVSTLQKGLWSSKLTPNTQEMSVKPVVYHQEWNEAPSCSSSGMNSAQKYLFYFQTFDFWLIITQNSAGPECWEETQSVKGNKDMTSWSFSLFLNTSHRKKEKKNNARLPEPAKKTRVDD